MSANRLYAADSMPSSGAEEVAASNNFCTSTIRIEQDISCRYTETDHPWAASAAEHGWA